ncbi:MAG: STAS domain-containing protein [Bacteroidetes bacterium]|nr:STAS domain-containing protein [Bacteroidota bacterium]MBU1114251.1 STAS domain-containing protein [Bacteroidota bacterium]MBU1797685.1 STAS domain-containing protein [Bacteroidota bacterium]
MIAEFIIEEIESTVVVRVQLDRATLSKAALFRDTIEELIQSGKLNIIIDCRNIAFMDSTFLGAIVVSLKKVNSLKGKFCLVFADKSSLVLSMLETTRMLKIIKIFFSIEDALKDFDLP